MHINDENFQLLKEIFNEYLKPIIKISDKDERKLKLWKFMI